MCRAVSSAAWVSWAAPKSLPPSPLAPRTRSRAGRRWCGSKARRVPARRRCCARRSPRCRPGSPCCGPRPAELAAEIPFEVASQLGEITETAPFPVAMELLGIWGAANGGGPVAVVVEDLHWADPESRLALLTAARRLREDPVLMLVTSRGGPEDADGWDRLRADPERCLHVVLGPLSQAEVAELAARRGRDADRRRGSTAGQAYRRPPALRADPAGRASGRRASRRGRQAAGAAVAGLDDTRAAGRAFPGRPAAQPPLLPSSTGPPRCSCSARWQGSAVTARAADGLARHRVRQLGRWRSGGPGVRASALPDRRLRRHGAEPAAGTAPPRGRGHRRRGGARRTGSRPQTAPTMAWPPNLRRAAQAESRRRLPRAGGQLPAVGRAAQLIATGRPNDGCSTPPGCCLPSGRAAGGVAARQDGGMRRPAAAQPRARRAGL